MKRKRVYMSYFSFIKEIRDIGFRVNDSIDAFWVYSFKGIELQIYGGYIECGELYPYTLILNGKRVIGNQRCLKYIYEILGGN